MKLVLTLFTWLAITGISVGQFNEQLDEKTHLSWLITNDAITITMSVQTQGWVGFGLSKSGGMLDSDVYVGFLHKGTQIINDYFISSRSVVCPGVCKDEDQGGRNDVTSKSVKYENGKTIMIFTRALNTGDHTDVPITKEKMIMIYAYSSSDDTNLQYHSLNNRGVFKINFYTGEVERDDRGDYIRKLFLAHGVLMFTVWNVVTSISILIARYFQPRHTARKIHQYIQQTVMLTSIPSFVIALHSVSVHYRTLHGILGVTFLAVCSVQGSLGTLMVFRVPFFNDPLERWLFRGRSFTFPARFKRLGSLIHPHLGKVLFVGSFVNVYTGLQLLDAGFFSPIFWVWMGVLVGFLLLQEGKNIYSKYFFTQTKVHEIHEMELQHQDEPVPLSKTPAGFDAVKKTLKNPHNLQILVFVFIGVIMLTSGIIELTIGVLQGKEVPSSSNSAILKTYYIQAEEVEWDYAPAGYNAQENRNFTFDELFYVDALMPTLIGRKYIKAVYQEYMDDSYKVRKEKPTYLGFLGPIIRAEVGETIVIHFRNNLTIPCSLHPHGVFYAKSDEGFHYNDGTSRAMADDEILPGQQYTFVWPVPERSGPAEDEGSSTLWLYHSHTHEHSDINSGLMGPIIVTRKGMTNRKTGMPKDIDQEFVVLFLKLDELSSGYIGTNIAKYTQSPANVSFSDPIVREHNVKRTINGYMFGNMPILNMTRNENVRWPDSCKRNRKAGNYDTPNISFYGHLRHGARQNRQVLVDVTAYSIGVWKFFCHVDDHRERGMTAKFRVLPDLAEDDKSAPEPIPASTPARSYYIAAEEVLWNYAPSGLNKITNLAFSGSELLYTLNTDTWIGTQYKKAVYREYEDETFTTVTTVEDKWEHLGMLGPVIRGKGGDTIFIYFKNKATIPLNIVPHGLVSNSSAAVVPGATAVFAWYIPERATPTDLDVSTIPYLYHSGVSETGNTMAGLMGVVLVARSNETLTPANVDKEFVLMYTIMDENYSSYLAENMATFTPNVTTPPNPMDPTDFVAESNRKYTINGYIYGNLASLEMSVGDRVRWYVVTLGSEGDVHSPRWPGQTLLTNNKRMDTATLLPATHQVADMIADTAGSFVVDCFVTQHTLGGAQAIFTVSGVSAMDLSSWNGKVNTYYIAAEEVDWNYSHFGMNVVTNTSYEQLYEVILAKGGPNPLTGPTIGSVYKKAVYIEYTDATFATPKAIPDEWKHTGFLGPIVRGEVGDMIKIYFKNKATLNFNLKPTGVTVVNETVTGSVAPNGQALYTWFLPEKSGPTPDDVSSLIWFYRSTVSEVTDTTAGLLGPLIVTRQGEAKANGMPVDVDREFVVYFATVDENVSPYLVDSITNALGDPSGLTYLTDFWFYISNFKASLNGYIFGNNPHTYEMTQGEIVRWYIMVLGGQAELHSAHWHAVTLTNHGKRLDVLTLQPAQMTTADMITDNPGTWLFHCHVNEHLSGGMVDRFTIIPS